MMHVVVVGAGMLGVSVAQQLARRGARVRIVDQHKAAGCGVSGASFAWVNLLHGDPEGSPLAFRLRVAAVAAFADLAADFGAPPWCRRVGSLFWHDDADETRRLVERHRDTRPALQWVDAAACRALEPALLRPPCCAVYSPDDRAVDIPAMLAALLHDAQARGVSVGFGERVTRIAPHDGRHATVTTTAGVYHADAVVLANALGANALLEPFGTKLPVAPGPAVLLRFATERRLARGIVGGPALELRQEPDGTVFVAEMPDPLGDDWRLVGPVTRRIAELFGPVPDLRPLSVVRAARPMPRTECPIVGFVPKLPGLYALVAHPGVILAPLIARAAADELVLGLRATLLGDWAAALRASKAPR